MTQVTIIGAGIAGLSLALGCARRGIEVIVSERSPVMQAVGAGLTIASSARTGLGYLGLGEAIDALAEPPDPAILRDWSTGRPITSREDAAAHLWDVRRVARADLQSLLMKQVLASGRAEVRLGKTLVGVETSGDTATARFEDGESLTSDILIGADGARSGVRAALFGDGPPSFTGHIAWRFILPLEAAASLTGGYGASITAGPRGSLTCYTMGQGTQLNCVAITRSDEWASEGWSEPGDPKALAAIFADAHPDAQALIAMAQEGELFRWGLFDRPVTPNWSKGRALLMGDAAHPVLPFLAFGAGLAIEDAVVLDRALAAYPPQEAFAAFEQARIPRAIAIHAASRAQARAFELVADWDKDAPPPFLDPAIHQYDPVATAITP